MDHPVPTLPPTAIPLLDRPARTSSPALNASAQVLHDLVARNDTHSPEHKPAPPRRTKIVVTLGPASIPKIRELIIAGVNCFRLNFSHVTDPESQTPVVEEIRRATRELNIPVAILGDLGGPKIRCNDFGELPSIPLVTGSTIRLVSSTSPGDPSTITTPIAPILRVLEPSHRVLLDDGALVLRVTRRISESEVECLIVVGGTLKPHKGINVPDVKLEVPAVTEKDKRDAKYMFRMRMEYVALSFVQTPEDVEGLLELFREYAAEEAKERKAAGNEGAVSAASENEEHEEDLEEDFRPHIISKIERPQALDCIDDIIRVTDGIMVARGDLGVEVSLEQVPVIQKILIRKTNLAEKPVITATQMLESMINSVTPTRAEVSDVSNAVLDGTDAVMLSGETAVGLHVIETVKMMSSICQSAESGALYMQPRPLKADEDDEVRRSLRGRPVSEFAEPVADAAVAAAKEAKASAIIVFTTSGDMPTYVSKRRPTCPIISITPTPSIQRRLSLLYGIYPILSTAMRLRSLTASGGVAKLKEDENPDHKHHTHHRVPLNRNTDVIYAQSERDIIHSCGENIVQSGAVVVYCAGYHGPWPGLSNTLKLARFGSERQRELWVELVDHAHKVGKAAMSAGASKDSVMTKSD
ncbi:Pyruvate/Phosphoenolpyruvate kinase-like domain-containing protein [Cladochytrium replicatum]|nr:Pyruvate/Phosphoenolpyruvate kinase-like domain-containing protein [Cladochytrium replicatum]